MSNNHRPLVINMLNEYIDDIMFENGFKRRSNSIVYSRRNDVSVQKVDFVLHNNPYFMGNAKLWVYPLLCIKYKDLYEELKRVYAEQSDNKHISYYFYSSIDFMLQQPIESKGWFIYNGSDDYKSMGERIRCFLTENTIPVLNNCDSYYGLTKIYEQNTSGLSFNNEAILYVIAAYMKIGESDKAHALIDKRFNKLGLKFFYDPLVKAYGSSSK